MRQWLSAACLAILLAVPMTRAHAAGCEVAKTQADLQTCTAGDSASADKALNAIYKILSGKLGPADQQRLRKAQRAWIAFRDQECAFRTKPYADGSVYGSLVETCVADLTKARLSQLQFQLKCPEGDLACVPRSRAAAPAPAKPAAPVSTPAASQNDTRPCVQSAGKAKSDEYVSQCVQVSPATHPPCNGQNACAMMIEEIKRGCAMIGKDNPPGFCSAYKG